MKFNYSNDERIEKKSELINVRPYILMQLFAIIVIELSLFNKNIKFPGFGIALIILFVCNSYIILRFLFLGINLKYLFKKCNDEAIIEFKNKFISQAFNIGVYLTIFLQFILVFVFKNFSNIIYSSLIWFVPSIYATYNYVKKGTLVKPKKDIKNQIKAFRNEKIPNFNSNIDDYALYIPFIMTYTLYFTGMESKNNLRNKINFILEGKYDQSKIYLRQL